MALINTIFTLITKFGSSEHDKHHTFDNFGGSLIIIYHFLLALIFYLKVFAIYADSRAKVKKFILYFALFGGIYIMALPIIVIFGNYYIQAKDRREFVFVTMETLKCATNIAMSIMLN